MTDATFPGNGNYFARLEAWRSGFTVYGRLTVFKTSGTGYWTYTPQAYGAAAAGVSFNGSWTYDFRNYSSVVVREWSQAVAGPGDYVVDAWVDMDGFGRADPAAITINVPPNAPAAPSNLDVTRNSDTSQNVYWKDNASVAAPYTLLQVQRKVYDGAWPGWTAIAGDGAYNTGSGNRSYSDSGTVANRIYVYRIYVNNTAGEAATPESRWVFTSPAAPSAVQAVKQQSGSIVLSWTKGTPHTEINSSIDYSIDGGTTWTALVSGLAGNVSTYTHATPPAAASIVYRARHTIETAAPGAVGIGLTSGYGQSNSVPLTAPPLAPSALVPNGLVFDAVTAQNFTWQHNTADSSSQTAYEIQYRIGTGAWTSTGKITSTASLRAFAANTFINGNSYEWQVRTWGAHASASPWSSSATFTTSAAPLVVINTPPNPLGAALVTTTWTYSDSEGTAQSMWEAQLLRSGSVLEQLTGSGTTSTASFTTRLTDATAYQVQVRARDGSGLWSSWAQKTFVTSFPAPTVPTITANWNTDTGTVGITVTNPATGTAVVENRIQRSLDGGQTWIQVAVTPPNGTGFDRTVPVGITAQYRVIAWTALPSSSQSAVILVTTASKIGYWSGGNSFEKNVQLRVNYKAPPKLDLETGLADKVLHYFAGRTQPVETSGTATQRRGSVEFMVSSIDELQQVRALALIPAPHLIRMPDGTTVFASIGPVSEKRQDEGWYRIAFKVTEVSQ